MGRDAPDEIELSEGHSTSTRTANSVEGSNQTLPQARDDNDFDLVPLNAQPDSSALPEDHIPTVPDGDVDEHRAQGGFFSTKYVSLDPSRRLSVWLGKGRWAAIAAVCTLFIFLVGSAVIALWESESATQAFSGKCPYLEYAPALDTIRPRMYNISLTFSEANFEADDKLASNEFEGRTNISFTALKDTSQILLHSVGLNYTAAILVLDGVHSCICGAECLRQDCTDLITPLRSKECDDFEAVSISLGLMSLVESDNAQLVLSYTGRFHQNQGLYRSDKRKLGKEPDNAINTNLVVVTQLEMRGARRVFPCVDEPSQKAVFNVDVQVPQYLNTILSNTEGSVQVLDVSTVRAVFRPTPIMSTYLLALCMGRAEHFGPLPGHPTVRTFHLDFKSFAQADPLFAYEEAVLALRFYEAWTGVKQPLEKFDMVAVPGKTGAMENWGLLLFDPERFSTNWDISRFYGAWRMADVICHEVAHQWFGNMVTAADWRQLTVNEGISSFMEYLCLQGNQNGTEVSDMGHFLSQRSITPLGQPIGVHEGPRQVALTVDSQPYTSPLVPAPGDAPPAGEITYSKGSAILAMLHAVMEAAKPGSFQEGMKKYLRDHMYGTATVEDVLAALAATSAEDQAVGVRSLSAYFHNPGYPLLTVKPGKDETEVIVGQSRYLDWEAAVDDDSSLLWNIPISLGIMADSKSANPITYWMTEKEIKLTIPVSGAWTLNAHGKGLYRVEYPVAHLRALVEGLKNLKGEGAVGSILAAEALVNDVFSLFLRGSLSAEMAVLTAQAASQSPLMATPGGQYLLGAALVDWLDQLKYLLRPNDTCSQDLKAFVRLLSPIAKLIESRLSKEEKTKMPGDSATLFSLTQDRILSEVALAGDEHWIRKFCTTHYLVAPWAASKIGMVRPPGCNIEIGAVESWMEIMQISAKGARGEVTRKAALFLSAYTPQESLVKIMVDAIVDQDLQTLYLGANVTGDAKITIAPTDEVPLLEVLSRTKFGAITVWNALYSRLQKGADPDRLWGLLSKLRLYPTKDVLSAMESVLQDVPRNSQTSAQKQAVGKLQHHVTWRANTQSELCSALKHH